MRILPPRGARRWAGVLLLAFAPAACDRADPLAPDQVPEPPAGPSGAPVFLAAVQCRVDVPGRKVTCGGAPELPPEVRGLIVSAQAPYVNVTAGTATQVADTIQWDATVQNLIAAPQSMGTTNGTTASSSGVRVFFDTDPVVTSGTGTVSVANEDGVDLFTAANQAYFQYSGALLGPDGILSSSETSSAKTWKFQVDPGVVTFTYTLYVATDVPYPNGWISVSPSFTRIALGETQNLSATVYNAGGGTISGGTLTWSSNRPTIISVNSSGQISAVGQSTLNFFTTISVTDGTRSGSATVQQCPWMNVGASVQFSTASGSTQPQFCLPGLSSGAEYVVVPINVGSTSVPITVTGTGIIPVSGAPTPDRLPGAGPASLSIARSPLAGRFEALLRERERAELTPLMAGARAARASAARAPAGGARFSITPGVPSVGDYMDINVETDNSCSTSDLRTGQVKAVGTNVVVLADTNNPSSGLSTSDYQEMAADFDTLVWAQMDLYFDTPEDIDVNSRVVVFYTKAVNELTPTGGTFVRGFFMRRDLFPSVSCATSNEGELIYLAAADPSGTVNGNARSVSEIKTGSPAAMAHELQHLVNASRRLYVNGAPAFEETWLEEGMSHIAEELLFYYTSPVMITQNLAPSDVSTAFLQTQWDRFAAANFARFRLALQSPTTQGLFQTDNDEATRGATWAFLRYAANRRGLGEPSFWGGLVNATTTGRTNLSTAIGTDAENWYRDFGVAIYADDAIAISAPYSLGNWNYRSWYATLDYNGDSVGDGYPLSVFDPSDATPLSFTLSGGGTSGHARLGVPSSSYADVLVRSSGGLLPTTSRLVVIRRK